MCSSVGRCACGRLRRARMRAASPVPRLRRRPRRARSGRRVRALPSRTTAQGDREPDSSARHRRRVDVLDCGAGGHVLRRRTMCMRATSPSSRCAPRHRCLDSVAGLGAPAAADAFEPYVDAPQHRATESRTPPRDTGAAARRPSSCTRDRRHHCARRLQLLRICSKGWRTFQRRLDEDLQLGKRPLREDPSVVAMASDFARVKLNGMMFKDKSGPKEWKMRPSIFTRRPPANPTPER